MPETITPKEESPKQEANSGWSRGKGKEMKVETNKTKQSKENPVKKTSTRGGKEYEREREGRGKSKEKMLSRGSKKRKETQVSLFLLYVSFIKFSFSCCLFFVCVAKISTF